MKNIEQLLNKENWIKYLELADEGGITNNGIAQDIVSKIQQAINYTPCCKSDSELLNVFYNVGDKVLFDNKKAVVLWTSVNYLNIEIVGTNKILQGVHTSKVLPR